MQRNLKTYLCHYSLLFALIIVTISFFAFSKKKTESKFYDNKGRLIADSSYKITQEQLNIFLKFEDKIIKCYLKNLKYPQKAYEFSLESSFYIAFSINEKTGNMYGFTIVNPVINLKQSKEKVLQIFSEEILRVNKICSGEDKTPYLSQNNIYYLPFKFKLVNKKPNKRLSIMDGYIYIPTKRIIFTDKYF